MTHQLEILAKPIPLDQTVPVFGFGQVSAKPNKLHQVTEMQLVITRVKSADS